MIEEGLDVALFFGKKLYYRTLLRIVLTHMLTRFKLGFKLGFKLVGSFVGLEVCFNRNPRALFGSVPFDNWISVGLLNRLIVLVP